MEENKKQPEKDITKQTLYSIRIFAFISAAIVVFADYLNAWSEDWPALIIMMMSLYIISWSYRPLLANNKKTRLWISVILFILLLIGFVIIYNW